MGWIWKGSNGYKGFINIMHDFNSYSTRRSAGLRSQLFLDFLSQSLLFFFGPGLFSGPLLCSPCFLQFDMPDHALPGVK